MRISRSSLKAWAAGLLALLLAPEAVLYLGARRAVVGEAKDNCSVIALGFPGRRDGSPGDIQRFRMKIALDAFKAHRCRVLIVAGGSPHSAKVEAQQMAELATGAGFPADKIFLEKRSRNTWENIRYSLPFLRPGEHVLLASDVAHALRARSYVCRQDPDLCPRAHVAAPFEPREMGWYQWLSVYWNLKSWIVDSLGG